MKKFARIYDGRVVEFVSSSTDVFSMFHPALTWIDITSLDHNIAEGWSYYGGKFLPPVRPSPVEPSLSLDEVQVRLETLMSQLNYLKERSLQHSPS